MTARSVNDGFIRNVLSTWVQTYLTAFAAQGIPIEARFPATDRAGNELSGWTALYRKDKELDTSTDKINAAVVSLGKLPKNFWRDTEAQARIDAMPSERIPTGDFSSSVGWTTGADWNISGGKANGTPGTTALICTLTKPIQNNADLGNFQMTITNKGGNEVAAWLWNSSTNVAYVLYDDTLDGIAGPSNGTAGTTGPYDQLRIFNLDGFGNITIDDITLVV